MPGIDLVVETPLTRTTRIKQLEAMFDVPAQQKAHLEWHGELPIEQHDWHIGLIVGPSGSGKSTILRALFGPHVQFEWTHASVVDDFPASMSIQDIAAICQAVGFNTIPAWMRPYRILSNGEQFRVDLARRLVELADPIVVDEFSSVVDRQVAQIGAHAVQKYVRRGDKRFIAATCHYDVIEWLQPDWILEPATMSFTRRSLQGRPALELSIARVDYAAWRIFAPFHYLSAELNHAARCYVLSVNDTPASFAGVLHRPHPRVNDIAGISRLVTLPDWQGLGLAMFLCDTLGAAHKSVNKRLHMYPAHPALIRSFTKSEQWGLTKRAGTFNAARGKSSSLSNSWRMNTRANAVFEYCGPALPDRAMAQRMLYG